MTYYFGFEPTDKLHAMIDEAKTIVATDADQPYYPLRNKIAHQIGEEIIESLLVNLIQFIPDPARQERLKKIVVKIEGATNTMLNILLGKDKNKDVLPNLDYLENETVFTDNDGKMRIGFEIDEQTYNTILEGFDTSKPIDMSKLKTGLKAMNHGVVDHFVTRFSETLPLGMIKRKAIPMGKSAINTGLDIAINKLVPGLTDESLVRLSDFYRPFIVKKES